MEYLKLSDITIQGVSISEHVMETSSQIKYFLGKYQFLHRFKKHTKDCTSLTTLSKKQSRPRHSSGG
jgi:hypothetical protein